jgi:hypothetical protein
MTSIEEYKEPAVKPKVKKATIVLGLLLLSVVAAASYTVMTARMNVTVGEAFEVEYAYISPEDAGDCATATYGLVAGNTFDISGMPGDTAKVCVKVINDADVALPFNVATTNWDTARLDITTALTCTGDVAANGEAVCAVIGTIKDDAAPGTAAVDIAVTRG